jgi:hypothetical protein
MTTTEFDCGWLEWRKETGKRAIAAGRCKPKPQEKREAE